MQVTHIVTGGEVDIFADGGMITRNPCKFGITWCWIQVRSDGIQVAEAGSASAYVMGEDLGYKETSNNVAEILAIIEALEAAPVGWAGTLHSDSNVALCTIASDKGRDWITPMLVERMVRAKKRVGAFKTRLLGGHPTKVDLENGFTKKRGLPCSPWNVECDKRCTDRSIEAKEFLKLPVKK